MTHEKILEEKLKQNSPDATTVLNDMEQLEVQDLTQAKSISIITTDIISYLYPYTLSDDDWKKQLSPNQYKILREKQTEKACTWHWEYIQAPPRELKEEIDKDKETFFPDKGCFECVGCSKPLYSATSKYLSGSGWPAFDKCYKDSIIGVEDTSHNWKRIELVCKNCGGHLGHIFKDGKHDKDETKNERQLSTSRTKQRHSVNSVAIKFNESEPETILEEETLDLTVYFKAKDNDKNYCTTCSIM